MPGNLFGNGLERRSSRHEPEAGIATFQRPRQELFLDISPAAPYNYREETARTIDAYVRDLLGAAHERVQQTLMEYRETLEALALLMMQREVVDRTTFTGNLSWVSGADADGVRQFPGTMRDPVCGMRADEKAAAV